MSPFCIAVATGLATVGIATSLFFVTWRLVIDLHQWLTGTPMSDLGVWAFAFIFAFVVLPIMIATLGICLDRCVAWWQGVLTFGCSCAATIYLISSPKFRFVLPIAILGERTNSSQRWYIGAIVQLLIALFLLRYFRRIPRGNLKERPNAGCGQ